jgi:hypothetical protein
MTNGFYPTSESKQISLLNISEGNAPGYSVKTQLGVKESLTTAQDIWDVAGSLVYPTGAETLDVVTTGEDNSTGTGAQEVTLVYLDTSYEIQTAIAPTTAGTATITTTNFFRVRTFNVTGIGSSGVNANDIILRITGNGNIRATILAGKNTTFASHYTVPLDKVAIPKLIYDDAKKNDDADINVLATSGDDGIFRSILPLSVYQSALAINLDIVNQLPEKTDLRAVGVSQVSSKVSVLIQFIEVDKNLVNLS